MRTTIFKSLASIFISTTCLAFAGGCAVDPIPTPDPIAAQDAGSQEDAGGQEEDAWSQVDAGLDAQPTSLRTCGSWSDCLEVQTDGRQVDIGECCSSYAGVCVKGRMTGGCVGGSPGCPYPGQPHAGVCLADTSILPLPVAQCEVLQPADEWVPPTCATDADCRTVDAQGRITFDGCCAVAVGRCVKGMEHDYYGFPAVCAVRTDFAAPAELCE